MGNDLLTSFRPANKLKRREARFFLGFDKGYLEKMGTRKNLTATRRIFPRLRSFPPADNLDGEGNQIQNIYGVGFLDQRQELGLFKING
jgi:hypothetical protein